MSEYILLITPRQPRFTKAQLQTLVDIFVNSGSISLGSIFVPALFNQPYSLNTVYGLTGVIIFWLLATIVAGRITNG